MWAPSSTISPPPTKKNDDTAIVAAGQCSLAEALCCLCYSTTPNTPPLLFPSLRGCKNHTLKRFGASLVRKNICTEEATNLATNLCYCEQVRDITSTLEKNIKLLLTYLDGYVHFP